MRLHDVDMVGVDRDSVLMLVKGSGPSYCGAWRR